MTREEAIKLLECSATELVGTMMQTDEQTAVNQLQRYVDAFDVAIAALREQDSNANQHVSNTSNALGGWISVEERLPEAEKEVRVLCKASRDSKYRYQCQAFYEPKGMLREASNYGWDYECCSEYSEEDDDYFVNPGWYERIHNWDDYGAVGIADEVTHWMPLPEELKEEV